MVDDMRTNSKLELFRFITPVLITLCLAILQSIYADLNKIKDTVITLQKDMSSVQTNISNIKEMQRRGR